ncbi:MAG TPA: alcohol dehydrogenase catalytic domain-containing protein [Candidatus Cybelea sp.]|nr:alcohol dehydrogenase catalytic domain-containing protein [Candidatus Cybelea sp.]
MKAIRTHAQGGPELLAYEDAPQPALRSGDALVRVVATSITKTELTWEETYRDCHGRPRIPTIPGHEFAGIVDALAPEVAAKFIHVWRYKDGTWKITRVISVDHHEAK